MKKEYWYYLFATACGAVIWGAITMATGRREAWDSEWYFIAGIPAVCLVSMIFGYLEPQRAWRWGVLPLAGQFIWMLFAQGPGNLLPLGIIVFGVYSLPSVLMAKAGAYLGKRRIPTQ